MIKKILISVFIFFTIILGGFCIEKLNFNGFIADNAHLIDSSNEIALNHTLSMLQAKTKADVAVITLNSLMNKSIEDVSLEIARKYKLGDKELNNGVLIIVAPNERKARIEIGYGLEGVINDSKAGRILDDYMILNFKKGNYERGIIEGTLVVASEIAKAYNVDLSIETPAPHKAESNDIFDIIVIIIFIIILLNGGISFGGGSGFGGGGRRGRGSSGIRFGGGGGFGGGGASRGW